METTKQELQQKQEIYNQEEEWKKLFDYSQAKDELHHLIKSWATEIEETESRRNLRGIDFDIEQERNAGTIKQDETFIPVRLVDTNIRKEQPPFISYLKQSRRIATFSSIDNPEQSTEILEEAFTRGMTYEAWEIPHFKCLDGAQTHGWDSVEVVFDETKPLHVGIEHVGHERLIFAKDTINIQYAPKLLRRYDLTLQQLKEFTAPYPIGFGFDIDQVNKLLDHYKHERDKTVLEVYKVFFKWEKAIWVGWCTKETTCDNWLKAPEKLYLGIQHKEQRVKQDIQTRPNLITGDIETVPVQVPYEVWVPSDIQLYPIFILPYSETEMQKLFDHKGRVYLDEYKQEAMTAMITALVNGTTRASNIFASVENDDGSSIGIKQVQSIESGVIWGKPLKFSHMDYPDATVLRTLQYLQTLSTEETGQIAWAVNNREDSRKTATEIQTAKEQTSLLNSVQLTLFSTFIRSVYSFVWRIVQSQALQDKIKFLQLTSMPAVDPNTGQQIEQPLPIPTNDYATILQNYEIRAAGDIDVVQRAEKLNRMMQMWPLIATTPLALPFLQEILKVSFPEDANKWISFMNQALQAQQQMQQMQMQQQQTPQSNESTANIS